MLSTTAATTVAATPKPMALAYWSGRPRARAGMAWRAQAGHLKPTGADTMHAGQMAVPHCTHEMRVSVRG